MATKTITINNESYTLTYTITQSGATVSGLTKVSDSSDHLNQLKTSDEYLAEVALIEQQAHTPNEAPAGGGHQQAS